MWEDQRKPLGDNYIYISEGSVSYINSVWPVFLFEQLCLQLFPKKVYINPQSNPRSGLFLSSNMCYSHLNHVLHLTMTDVAKAIQDLCNQFKSLREGVDMLKKQRKSKKSKSRKSYSHSPSRDRRYHSRSRARSISPQNRERSSHPRSGARISHH